MKKFVLLVAVLALLGAACQSNTTVDTSVAASPTGTADAGAGSEPTATATGDDPGTASDDAEPTVAAEPTSAPAQDEPTTTGADPTPAPSPTVGAEPFEPSPEQLAAIQAITDADDWCTAAAAVETGLEPLDDLNFTNPVGLETSFTMAIAVITAAQPLAPPEIAADVSQTVEVFTSVGAALEDANWSFLDLDLAVIEQFDGPVDLATYNIERYNFVVCGIGSDPGEPPDPEATSDPSTDDSSSPDLPLEGTIRDQAVAGLVEAGFSEDEANCILSKLDLSDPEAFADTTALFNVFADCGISLDRLAQLGG